MVKIGQKWAKKLLQKVPTYRLWTLLGVFLATQADRRPLPNDMQRRIEFSTMRISQILNFDEKFEQKFQKIT